METLDQIRQSNATFRPIVAFDFDGTLTCKDSFVAFLAWRAGVRRSVLGLTRLAPAAIRYGLDHDRGRLKAAAVQEFLRGVTRETLTDDARRFAAEHSGDLLRPDALKCWKDWRARDARLVIVTASPEILVAPFARGLGAERVIGTRLAFDAQGRVSGRLDGANCRGPEKISRLAEIYGQDFQLAAAYGDSDGDREMLARAEESGLRVFGLRP